MAREPETPKEGFNNNDWLYRMIQEERFTYFLDFGKHFYINWRITSRPARGLVGFHAYFRKYKLQFIFSWPPNFYVKLDAPYRIEIYDLGRKLSVIRYRYTPSTKKWKCLTRI